MKRELSPRQREIMRLICRGSTDKEIAEALKLKLPTVANYIQNAISRLGARNRTHAAVLFVR